MYNDIAYLVKKTDTGNVDTYGDKIFTETKHTVYVNIESVGRTEFYTAQTAGFNPSIIFVLPDYYDYSDEPYIEYNNTLYKIIRTYRKGVSLQIVCQHEV